VETAQRNIRVQQWVAALSVVLLAAKLIAYYLTHSVAILTDALEGIVNVVAGFVGLYSLYLSAKPRDADHPYGHGKVEFVSAALEGSMIFLAGSLIVYESIVNLISPRTIHQLDTGMILIAAAGIINYVVGTICVKTGTKNNSLSLIASGKHLQSDTYSTIGILVGLVLLYFTNIAWIDSVTALIFSAIILYTGYKIVRTSIAGMMDETDTELLAKMVTMLNAHRRENWIDLHNLRIIKYGSRLHMDCHLTVPWYLNVHEAHVEIDYLAQQVRKEFGESMEMFVHSDGCLDFSCKICSKATCAVRKHPFERKVEWTVDNISGDEKHSVTT